MEVVKDESGQAQQEVDNAIKRFVFIGGTDPMLQDKLKEAMGKLFEDEKDVLPVIIGVEEASYLAQLKAEQKENEAFNEYLRRSENIKNAKTMVAQIDEAYKEITDESGFMEVAKIKKSSKYSWKEFKEVLGMLVTYGLVEFSPDRNYIKTTISESDRLRIKVDEMGDWRKAYKVKLNETLAVLREIDTIEAKVAVKDIELESRRLVKAEKVIKDRDANLLTSKEVE